MADLWANSGVDLHLDLHGSRVRESLERGLRDAVQSGRLVPGTLLPPSRALAADLGIARNTVTEAYGQLVAEGWLIARQGSGTRVAARDPALVTQPSPPPTPTRAARYDLRAGYPDVATFPRAEWMAAARSALAKAPHDSFGYGDPCGRPELRAALAEYLARARGVRASPDTIVVCSGFTQGLALLGRALSQSGARAIGVEAYGHRRHREVLTDAGLQLVSMPVDDQGAQPSGLDADAALLTPAHQFPLGMALSAERRSRFVDWAAKRDTYVIEDDYDGEFRYDRRPVGAMQALAPGHVIYAGTASKTLAPGLRLAWLVVPESLLPAVLDGHALIGAQPSVPDQLTLAEFIASGRYDRHIRRSRLAYQRRRDRLIAALARDVPSVTVRGMAAGMHAVLDLAEECDEREVVERAGRRDLAIDPLSEYTAEAHPPALVIGYATPPAHAFTSAVARLIATLADTSE